MIDTSAILAWLKDEPARDRIVAGLEAHHVRRMSTVSLLEVQIVVRGREHPALLGKLDRFLEEIAVIVVPFDEPQARALLTDPDITVEEVARRFGVGPSTLYRYLPAARQAG